MKALNLFICSICVVLFVSICYLNKVDHAAKMHCMQDNNAQTCSIINSESH